MFSLLKSLLIVVVLYSMFSLFNSMNIEEVFVAITPYLYWFAGILILVNIGVLIYFNRFKSKEKIMMIFMVIFAMAISSPAFAENTSSLDDNIDATNYCGACDIAVQSSSTSGQTTGDMIGCWPCDVFLTIFNIFDKIVSGVFTDLSSGLLNLVMAGYLIWLAYTLLMQFITFKDRDIGRLFTQIGKMTFVVLIISGFLSMDGKLLYDFILSPIVNIAAEYTGIIVNDSACEVSFQNETMILGDSLRYNLFCMINNLFDEIVEGMNLGSVLMCLSANKPVDSLWDEVISSLLTFFTGSTIPYFSALIFGFILWICYFIILIAFPFYIFDVLFRFCFFTLGLPFIIAFWPFSFFKIYIFRLMGVLLTGVMSFVILAILFRIMTGLFASVMNLSEISAILSYCKQGELMKMIDVLDTYDVSNILLSAFFLPLITYAVLLMMRTVSEASGKLVEYAGSELGALSGMDGISSQSFKAPINKVTGFVTGAVGATEYVGKKAQTKVNEVLEDSSLSYTNLSSRYRAEQNEIKANETVGKWMDQEVSKSAEKEKQEDSIDEKALDNDKNSAGNSLKNTENSINMPSSIAVKIKAAEENGQTYKLSKDEISEVLRSNRSFLGNRAENFKEGLSKFTTGKDASDFMKDEE